MRAMEIVANSRLENEDRPHHRAGCYRKFYRRNAENALQDSKLILLSGRGIVRVDSAMKKSMSLMQRG